jgi:hypothetical protein
VRGEAVDVAQGLVELASEADRAVIDERVCSWLSVGHVVDLWIQAVLS